MKKVNRNNSIRVLAAVLSTALIASMSGCNSKKKEVPSQNVEKELETLLDNSKRAHELEEILDFFSKLFIPLYKGFTIVLFTFFNEY